MWHACTTYFCRFICIIVLFFLVYFCCCLLFFFFSSWYECRCEGVAGELRGGRGTRMSEAEELQKAAVALHLQEHDDSILCAFGPDFFDGARKGAACGAVFTAWLSRRTYVELRDDFRDHEASVLRHLRRGKWTISLGFRTRPFLTLGCVSLALTALMKSVKFTLANYRYQEFVTDDIGFTLLEQMCADSPEVKEKLGVFIDGALADLKAGSVPPSGSNVNSYNLPYKNVTSALMQAASPLRERVPPSFWDGVAVGLLGSVMDCYLPSKPLQSYYGMRCGISV
ncbi:hypothetical protein TRSC58_06416 [Trypanosoma rangeli SC58]|uniref:Uncharacterized protein n=1 Tax=Trypanosoma rangeli SC58 TaxID=429131 RepID=A0A061ITL7_TRYRA|nr:hypothetical protein TRSC58_06416 [Trypanosoma rangeli SC58]